MSYDPYKIVKGAPDGDNGFTLDYYSPGEARRIMGIDLTRVSIRSAPAPLAAEGLGLACGDRVEAGDVLARTRGQVTGIDIENRMVRVGHVMYGANTVTKR